MNQVVERRKTQLAKLSLALIALAFLSKLSFQIVPGVPYRWSFLVYQHGLHPVLNFVFNFLLGLPLIWIAWKNRRYAFKQAKPYRVLIGAVAVVLTVQTIFQILFVNPEYSALKQIGGLVLTLFLIYVYGVLIPTVLPLNKFVSSVRAWALAFAILSVVVLFISPEIAYKGGRFAGVYKHIPHLVVGTTVGLIFLIPKVFSHKAWSFRLETPLVFASLFVMYLVIFLSATRAAIGACTLAFLGAFVIYGSRKTGHRILKFSIGLSTATLLVAFAPTVFKEAEAVATGKQALLSRAAQDGVASRIAEFSRGLDEFYENPHLGKGILYRFMGTKIEVDSYNSYQDPHNLFVSAGVVGGWPLVVLTLAGYLLMGLGALKGLLRRNNHMKMLGLLLLCHLPIFFIYHMHLSLGGLADRLYWLVWGYLAVVPNMVKSGKELLIQEVGNFTDKDLKDTHVGKGPQHSSVAFGGG